MRSSLIYRACSDENLYVQNLSTWREGAISSVHDTPPSTQRSSHYSVRRVFFFAGFSRTPASCTRTRSWSVTATMSFAHWICSTDATYGLYSPPFGHCYHDAWTFVPSHSTAVRLLRFACLARWLFVLLCLLSELQLQVLRLLRSPDGALAV